MDIFKPFINQLAFVYLYNGKAQVCKVLQHDHPKYRYILMTEVGKVALARCTEEGNCEDGKKIESISPFTAEMPKDPTNLRDVLRGLAEILVSAGPDDDKDDLVEEINEYMNTHCREMMDEVQCKKNDEVEKLKEQIKQLDSASYYKLLEQLNLHRF